MIDPVQRLVFRGQLHPNAVLPDLRPALEQRSAADQILTASLFRWRNNLFLYCECPDAAIAPGDLVGGLDQAMATWPGATTPRVWAPMMDIFHYNRPQSVEHWRRDQPPEARTARVIYLRPEMVSSYIFFHYQMQEEKPGAGDKYGQISIHENLLFFYLEQPATPEAAQHQGLLQTTNTPASWQEVMVPHFQPWNDEEGEELWRPIELVCSV